MHAKYVYWLKQLKKDGRGVLNKIKKYVLINLYNLHHGVNFLEGDQQYCVIMGYQYCS